jgi:two-component system chemotaxis response regulator CheY
MARILIIDDDRLICACLSQIARDEGHEFREAYNGKSGTDAAAHFAPELIFLDLLMPEQAGLETIVAIRKLLPRTFIVAMTGQPMVGAVSILDLAVKFGANDVLSKPFTINEVATLMQRTVSPP